MTNADVRFHFDPVRTTSRALAQGPREFHEAGGVDDPRAVLGYKPVGDARRLPPAAA